jgi:hypothetical protein
MTIAISTLFFIVCVGLGIWFKKDKSFRPREVIAVSAFWILLVATPIGADVVTKVQDMVGHGARTSIDTVDNVSSK